MQRDPIGLEGGLNTYGDVGGNPIIKFDLLGLFDGATAFVPPPGAPAITDWKDPCGCFAKALGLETTVGVTMVGAGMDVIPYPRKSVGGVGSTGATSIASAGLSRAFPQRLPMRIPAPTLKNPGAKTAGVGRALGRWVPLAGWAMLGIDMAQILSCMAECKECDSANAK